MLITRYLIDSNLPEVLDIPHAAMNETFSLASRAALAPGLSFEVAQFWHYVLSAKLAPTDLASVERMIGGLST